MDPSKRWETTRDMYDYKKVDAGEVDGQPVYVMEGVLKPGAVTNYQMIAEAPAWGRSASASARAMDLSVAMSSTTSR